MEKEVAPLLSLRKITKNFGGLTAVDNVDLDIYRGEITAIVGGNGAGKSTLIKMISGSYKPTSGEIYFKGVILPLGNPLAVRKLGIETIYQDLSLAELLNVPDNIFLGREQYKNRLGLKILDEQHMFAESAKIIKKLNLTIPVLDRPIRFLSGGQRQGVSICKAIYWRAELIIMDEPSLGLAPIVVAEIFEIIAKINKEQNTAVLLVEQNANMALSIAHYGYILENGRVVMEGPTETLREDRDIREFYLGLTELGSKKSFREVKHYRRRKRWLS